LPNFYDSWKIAQLLQTLLNLKPVPIGKVKFQFWKRNGLDFGLG